MPPKLVTLTKMSNTTLINVLDNLAENTSSYTWITNVSQSLSINAVDVNGIPYNVKTITEALGNLNLDILNKIRWNSLLMKDKINMINHIMAEYGFRLHLMSHWTLILLIL